MARGSNRRIGRSKKGRKRHGITVVGRKARSAMSGRYVVVGPRGGKTSVSSGRTKHGAQPEPRVGLFHGSDPTLAKRAEEELHNIAR